MENLQVYALGLMASYLLGCICTGYYLTNFFSGKNLRGIGSGSFGATNAGRVLGKKGFVLVFLLDFAKGALVAYITTYLGLDKIWVFLFGMMVVAGHIWPFQLSFSGGKGILTICFDHDASYWDQLLEIGGMAGGEELFFEF